MYWYYDACSDGGNWKECYRSWSGTNVTQIRGINVTEGGVVVVSFCDNFFSFSLSFNLRYGSYLSLPFISKFESHLSLFLSVLDLGLWCFWCYLVSILDLGLWYFWCYLISLFLDCGCDLWTVFFTFRFYSDVLFFKPEVTQWLQPAQPMTQNIGFDLNIWSAADPFFIHPIWSSRLRVKPKPDPTQHLNNSIYNPSRWTYSRNLLPL